ncbi:tripartite tricarboxylate transporter substrate binding protein [Reyranella massiliensis]|uniref:tripartite tricarboxylate transporter substrate binding protein n=1 Tax=Reyranella massiliensis TaxID=445220 RepID=UPI000300CE48|nr:tripartite tricarboxylate transporter substrate binding protein [Reyranella massiliensis]
MRLAVVAFFLFGFAAGAAQAQTRLVVPYTPGAANDTLARLLAQRLSAASGQTFLVENRPGAGGHLGAELVARAEPDGRTLLVSTNGLIAIGPHLYRKLPYDPQKDLAPVVRFANVPYALGASPALPAKSVGELLALARKQPESVYYASSGNGSVPHLCGELINLNGRVKMVHVPYKGGAQAMSDVVSGTVQLYCGSIPSLLGFTQSGKIRILGVTSAQRSPLLPDVPTFQEQGLTGVEVDSWVGLHAPAATPRPIIDRIAAEVAKVMASDEVRQAFLSQGAEPEAIGPQDFAKATREETVRWAPVVKASGATLD